MSDKNLDKSFIELMSQFPEEAVEIGQKMGEIGVQIARLEKLVEKVPEELDGKQVVAVLSWAADAMRAGAEKLESMYGAG